MIKKPSIAPKPQGSSIPDLADVINRAAANRENQVEKSPSKNKKQIPLMIPPALLETLDEVLASTRSGPSRSVWICDAIDKKLIAEGFMEKPKKKTGESAAEPSADE